MENPAETTASAADDNEEDYEHFFLQPASSPYNIAEKVKRANEALHMDNPDLDEREVRVKFRENLVDYEPSLTEDDVNSIESDEADDDDGFKTGGQPERSAFSDESLQSVINVNSGEDLEEEEEVVEEVADEEEEEDEEEEDDDEDLTEDSLEVPLDSESERTPPKTKRIKKRKPFAHQNRQPREIDCRNHCIPNLDLGLRINKLNIREKSPVRPLLKLQERKCCEEHSKIKNQNLPTYGGFRSEYGLSREQLERREKIAQIIRMKEQKRQQMLREFRERKRQQNEEVFCQWLKNVSKRGGPRKKGAAVKETLSPNIVNLPAINKEGDRPVTAPLPSRSPVCVRPKRRPQTSPAYIYIQVPQTILRRGISVGNIYVSLSGKNRNVDIVTKS